MIIVRQARVHDHKLRIHLEYVWFLLNLERFVTLISLISNDICKEWSSGKTKS